MNLLDNERWRVDQGRGCLTGMLVAVIWMLAGCQVESKTPANPPTTARVRQQPPVSEPLTTATPLAGALTEGGNDKATQEATVAATKAATGAGIDDNPEFVHPKREATVVWTWTPEAKTPEVKTVLTCVLISGSSTSEAAKAKLDAGLNAILFPGVMVMVDGRGGKDVDDFIATPVKIPLVCSPDAVVVQVSPIDIYSDEKVEKTVGEVDRLFTILEDTFKDKKFYYVLPIKVMMGDKVNEKIGIFHNSILAMLTKNHPQVVPIDTGSVVEIEEIEGRKVDPNAFYDDKHVKDGPLTKMLGIWAETIYRNFLKPPVTPTPTPVK